MKLWSYYCVFHLSSEDISKIFLVHYVLLTVYNYIPLLCKHGVRLGTFNVLFHLLLPNFVETVHNEHIDSFDRPNIYV